MAAHGTQSATPSNSARPRRQHNPAVRRPLRRFGRPLKAHGRCWKVDGRFCLVNGKWESPHRSLQNLSMYTRYWCPHGATPSAENTARKPADETRLNHHISPSGHCGLGGPFAPQGNGAANCAIIPRMRRREPRIVVIPMMLGELRKLHAAVAEPRLFGRKREQNAIGRRSEGARKPSESLRKVSGRPCEPLEALGPCVAGASKPFAGLGVPLEVFEMRWQDLEGRRTPLLSSGPGLGRRRPCEVLEPSEGLEWAWESLKCLGRSLERRQMPWKVLAVPGTPLDGPATVS